MYGTAAAVRLLLRELTSATLDDTAIGTYSTAYSIPVIDFALAAYGAPYTAPAPAIVAMIDNLLTAAAIAASLDSQAKSQNTTWATATRERAEKLLAGVVAAGGPLHGTSGVGITTADPDTYTVPDADRFAFNEANYGGFESEREGDT